MVAGPIAFLEAVEGGRGANWASNELAKGENQQDAILAESTGVAREMSAAAACMASVGTALADMMIVWRPDVSAAGVAMVEADGAMIVGRKSAGRLREVIKAIESIAFEDEVRNLARRCSQAVLSNGDSIAGLSPEPSG